MVATLVIFAVFVLSLGIWRGSSTVRGYLELKESREVLARTVAALRQENEEISAEIDHIETSPSYARRVLRDKYHVTDPGENIVFFAD